MANAKSEFMLEALRQRLAVIVYTQEFDGLIRTVRLEPNKLWTVTRFGFVNTGLTQSSISWVAWKKVFHMVAGPRHCGVG